MAVIRRKQQIDSLVLRFTPPAPSINTVVLTYMQPAQLSHMFPCRPIPQVSSLCLVSGSELLAFPPLQPPKKMSAFPVLILISNLVLKVWRCTLMFVPDFQINFALEVNRCNHAIIV